MVFNHRDLRCYYKEKQQNNSFKWQLFISIQFCVSLTKQHKKTNKKKQQDIMENMDRFTNIKIKNSNERINTTKRKMITWENICHMYHKR